MSKKRKLSKQETIRLEKFEQLSENLRNDGYEQKNLILKGAVKINLLSILITLPFAIPFIYFFCILNPDVNLDNSSIYKWLIILITVLCIPLHELIHGLFWGIFSKNHFKSVSFGYIASSMTPYCSCSEALKKWQYVVGALMPTIILGFILGVISFFCGNRSFLFIAIVMIFAGGGDIFIVFKILFYKTTKKEALFFDHPTELGLVVFER